MKKFLLLTVAFLLTACTPDEAQFKSTVPAIPRPAFEERAQTATQPETVAEPAPLPEAVNLDIPFFAQAPDADWSYPWQEACEEASITLAFHYFTDGTLSKEAFKKDILGLVDWQNKNFGNYIHSTVDQTAEMLEKYFGYTNYRILEDPTIEELKRELAQGHPIVAPFAGRMLGNPFYSGEGPYYHMMVLKGYDSENFITNDVGTKRGLDFIFPYETIMEAMHDYLPVGIENGPKKVIILD